LVFIQLIKYVNTIFESIQRFYTNIYYSNSQMSLFSSEAMSSNFNHDSINGLNPYYVTGFTDGEGSLYLGLVLTLDIRWPIE
jgi:hypothetical protein